MTHPTTEPNIRERLARASFNRDKEWKEDTTGRQYPTWRESVTSVREVYYRQVDAILAELENPSDGMKTASDLIPHARDEEIWRAMIRHIRGGGK